MRPSASVLCVVLVLAIAGCHTMRFELANEPTAQTVTERKSYYLWGLTPTEVVDVRQRCPYGAAAVKERTTFVDGLLGALALGIWSPRSSTYYCRAADSVSALQ